ncbi:MAG: HD domain-containing protein [Lachnospiraceae bacterium]|nr:HD domain-containing protein [Lachnospiraceae bacterium]MBR3637737.1 HD domain-containing protein [Lachnospiraceae bacterium]
MKLDKSERRSILVFAILFVLLVLVFVYTVFTWRMDNTQEFVTSITKEDRTKKGENNEDINIFVAMTQKESWPGTDADGKSTIGAEYDGVIFNNSGKNIVDWSMTIYMPKNKNGEPIPGTFDSSWNGEYTNNGDNITFIPADYLNVIPKNEEKTYGFVMYAGTNLDFSEFEICGYYRTILPEYPGFWIATVGFLIWLTWVVAWAVMDARARKLKKQKAHDEKIIEETMQVFANFIDAKDEYTKGHSTRVSFYSQKIAKRMGMSDEEIKMIGYMGLMHDCGKIAIPDDVLNKKGALTEEEREIIKEHTTRGGQMLENFTSLPGIRDGALYHHERYDGKGYPQGLIGKEIPLYARIINVADAFDAMNSDRCYRNRLPKNRILSELRNNAGTQFDPEIVEYMIAMYQEGKI